MDDLVSSQSLSNNGFGMKIVVWQARLCFQTSVFAASFAGSYKGQLKLDPVTRCYPVGSKYHVTPSTNYGWTAGRGSKVMSLL